MIFVSMGTEQYPFNALLDWIDLLIQDGIIQEEVIVQYGSSTKLSDRITGCKFLPEKKFIAAIEQANAVIAHCGEGTALLLEDLDKPYVLVPRTHLFHEHVDDHQLEMADDLEKQGISVARSPGDLVKFLKLLITSQESQLVDETELCKYLNDRYTPERYPKVMLVCSSGGHFKAMQGLRAFWQQGRDTCWITFRTPTTESELHDRRVRWAFSPTNRNVPNLVRNLILAFQVLLQEKPDAIVSTGAGVAVPFLLIGKLLSKFGVLSPHLATVFIESKTRVQDLSLSARILRFFGSLDQLIVRNQRIAGRYAGVEYVPVASELKLLSQNDFKQTMVTCFEEFALIATPKRFSITEARLFLDDFKNLCNPDEPFEKIAIDMSATQFIDSTGIGALVSCLKQAVGQGKELVLWSVNPNVMSILAMTGLVQKDGRNSVFVVEKATQTARTSLKDQKNAPITLHPSLSGVRGWLKRAIDIVGAVVGLAFTAILFIPLAIAIRLDSPGPILFKQGVE